MESLSVVIITFNEEKNIGRCLESVKDVADEIVVVDSFSTDRTTAICLEHHARVIQHPFDGYIEQKNFAITQVTHSLVLSLDADEALSPELKSSILREKENRRHSIYRMNRLTNYCGTWIRHGSWYPDRKIRLFIRGTGKWGGRNPHDQYEPIDNSSIGFLQGDILHYSYYSIEGHRKQAEKFALIGAKSSFEAGVKPSGIRLLIRPAFRFFRDYILLGGFLDGSSGFRIARMSAQATFWKYSELNKLWKEKKS